MSITEQFTKTEPNQKRINRDILKGIMSNIDVIKSWMSGDFKQEIVYKMKLGVWTLARKDTMKYLNI